MKKLMVSSRNWASTLALSTVLFTGAAAFNEANALANSNVAPSATPATQLAWWAAGGGYGGPGYRGYGYGYNYGPRYYRPTYYGRHCTKQCWRDRWNRLQCVTRCR